MISIIIPVYNDARHVEHCLSCIFRQTYKEFEIIAVDDGSTDHSLNVLRQFVPRITLLHQENRGASSARNRGATQAKGEFLLFCDADVLLKPQALAMMKRALDEHPEASFAYSSFRYGWKLFRLQPFDHETLRRRNYIHTTSLLRRKHFVGFDECLRRFQDWDIWLTLSSKGHTGTWIPQVLFRIELGGEGISQWFPKIFYTIPWKKLHLPEPGAVTRYREAEAIIQKKHHFSH